MAFQCWLHPGDRISIEDHVLTYVEFESPGRVKAMLGAGDVFQLSWDRRLEILPGVFAYVERNPSTRAKFFIKAPDTVTLKRVQE